MALHDLSHPIETGMQVFPGDPHVDVHQVSSLAADGSRVSAVSCGSHTGTHIDAPSHTEPDGDSIDEFSIDRFVFDARVVDLRDKGDREAIGPSDLPQDSAVDLSLLWTGWDRCWGTDRYLDHPYLSPEAARHCASRGWSVGIDALNPDPTPTENTADDEPDGVPVHSALLGDGRFIIENLTNLGSFEQGTLHAHPMPIGGGDGAPVRAVAEAIDP